MERPSETRRVLLKRNKFVQLVHLVGFTIGIYHNARTYERQIHCEDYYHTTCLLTFKRQTEYYASHEMYILFIQKGKHYPAMDIQIECAPAAQKPGM